MIEMLMKISNKIQKISSLKFVKLNFHSHLMANHYFEKKGIQLGVESDLYRTFAIYW